MGTAAFIAAMLLVCLLIWSCVRDDHSTQKGEDAVMRPE